MKKYLQHIFAYSMLLSFLFYLTPDNYYHSLLSNHHHDKHNINFNQHEIGPKHTHCNNNTQFLVTTTIQQQYLLTLIAHITVTYPKLNYAFHPLKYFSYKNLRAPPLFTT